MVTPVATQGYFSVLRWRSDPTRDEARNIAVLVVDRDGRVGGMRHAPVSSISPRLSEQGLLDSILHAMEQRFEGAQKVTLDDLERMHTDLHRSLCLLEPRPVAIADVDLTLQALYRAYAAPRAARDSKKITKGRVMDRVVDAMRRGGLTVKRSAYVGDFLIDIVVDHEAPVLCEALSFGNGVLNPAPIENDAAHFLYGLERLKQPGLAYIQPPAADDRPKMSESHNRVRRWFEEAGVEIFEPSDVAASLRVLATT